MTQALGTPIAVLLSGRGSNFLALHSAIERGELPARIALVISNVADAPGFERAKALGLPAQCIPHRGEPSREAHEAKLILAIREAQAEWICLAGYLRLLSPSFVRAFSRRIVNVHPSLLPAFPGLEAQRQAWDYGVRVAGCTVHLVDEGLDSGPIVMQRTVRVEDDDSEGLFAEKILVEEHKAYPEALRRLLLERWTVEGRRLAFHTTVAAPEPPIGTAETVNPKRVAMGG